MSAREFATVRAIRKSGLPATQRHVLIEIALFANGEAGRCDAAMATIGEHTGLNERTVRRAVHSLLEAGWLSTVKRATFDEPAVFQVTIPRGDTVSVGGGTQSPPEGGHEGGHEGGQRIRRSARSAGSDLKQQQQGGQTIPSPQIHVTGVEHSTNEPSPEDVGALLNMETEYSGLLQPHRDSAEAVRLHLRRGKPMDWFDLLFRIAESKGVKRLSWTWLLGSHTWACELREEADAEVELLEQRRRERERGPRHDPMEGLRPPPVLRPDKVRPHVVRKAAK